jgi:hypothetical protein
VVAVLSVGQASVAVFADAVGDVAGEREREGVPVELVGACDGELTDRYEVSFDGLQVAGVARGRDELDPVARGEAADVWGPIGREVVLDPADPSVRGVAATDLRHECEDVLAAPFGTRPHAQPVGVHVGRAEHVAGALPAVVVGALALRSAVGRPAAGGGRAQADRSHLVGSDHDPVVLGRSARQLQHPCGLGFVVGVRAGLPGPRALEGQVRLSQHTQCRSVRRTLGIDALVAAATGARPDTQGVPAAYLAEQPIPGDRDDRLAVITLDPASTPATTVRAQRVKPPARELADHLAHTVGIGQPTRGDRRRRHSGVRTQHDRRTPTRRRVLRTLRQPLEPQRLLMRERPDNTSGGRITTSQVEMQPDSPPTAGFRSNNPRKPTKTTERGSLDSSEMTGTHPAAGIASETVQVAASSGAQLVAVTPRTQGAD